MALVGPSGSGKSTIARLIASLWDVADGSINSGLRYAYLEGVGDYEDAPRGISITLRKSPQKNKFWLHVVNLSNTNEPGLSSSGDKTQQEYNKAQARTDIVTGNAEESKSKLQTWDSAEQIDTPQFKRWFGKSKVVDEDGRPLIVYHGTEADFTVFDRTKGRANMDIQGMFFSPWEEEAEGYLNLLNEDNRRHFIRGGKTVPDFDAFYSGSVKDSYGLGSKRVPGIAAQLAEARDAVEDAKNAGREENGGRYERNFHLMSRERAGELGFVPGPDAK